MKNLKIKPIKKYYSLLTNLYSLFTIRYSLSIFLIFIVFSVSGQEISFKSKIISRENNKPIENAVVYIIKGKNNLGYTTTDKSGEFEIKVKEEGKYLLSLNKGGHSAKYVSVNITKEQKLVNNFYIYKAKKLKIHKTREKKLYIDFNIAYNNKLPGIDSSSDNFKTSFDINFFYSFRYKYSNFGQMGLNLSFLKFAHHFLNNDTIITSQIFKKEKYYAWYNSVELYNRFNFNNNNSESNSGFFADLGITYNIPWIFNYSYYLTSDIKHTYKHFYKFNELRTFVRIGYYPFSIKASYLLFDVLNEGFVQLPKYTIGLEINLPLE